MHFAGLLILGGHQQNAAQKRPRTDSDATGNVDWTDDEVELPLGVVRSYSFQKDQEGLEWEIVKNQYEDIRKEFISLDGQERGEKDTTT